MSDYRSKMAQRRKRRDIKRHSILLLCVIAVAASFLIPDGGKDRGDAGVFISTDDGLSRYATVTTNPDLDETMIDYTGFKVSFNPVAHVPNWVVWELSAGRLSEPVVSRDSGSFATDRNVAGCATTADYRRSGYDRGHMAPAADMKWNADAMRDCFMLTNIAPQATALNTGAWNKLEQACRNVALRDSVASVVVVSGPVMTRGYETTIGDTQVMVPPAFFKVVLYKRHDGALASIGFIMNNGKVDGGMQKSAMTVDQVELITGHDFFSTLPDSIEAVIESTFDFYNFSTGR